MPDGTQWAAPDIASARLLAYNTDLFKKAGLTNADGTPILLADSRDLDRLTDGFRRMAAVQMSAAMQAAYRSSRLSNISNTTFMCTFNIICKREKRIRSQRNTCQLIQPCTLLFSCEYFRLFCKYIFPCTVSQYIHVLFSDVNINCIISLCTADRVFKRKIQYLRALA